MNTQNQFLSFNDLPTKSQTLYVKDSTGEYQVAPLKDILLAARNQVGRTLNREKGFNQPNTVKSFFNAKLAALEHEVFAVAFLDNHLQLIEYREMFHGTVDNASVYPREVAKMALRLNASAIVISHNHPSGINQPSGADIQITSHLTDALALIGVRLLDHILVAGSHSSSFAEMGYL